MTNVISAVVGVIAAMLILLSLLYLFGSPPPPVSVWVTKGDKLAVAAPAKIEQRWSAPPEVPVVPLTVTAPPELEPMPVQVATSAREYTETKRKFRRSYAYDICRGKGRYYTNGGRSWRCRRN